MDKNEYTLTGVDEISDEEIARRTAFAKMRQLELSVLKDQLSLADKSGELCRIDVALAEFDAFLVDFVRMIRQFPDKVQELVPQLAPQQYSEIMAFIDDSMQRLAQKRLHLTIESTKAEKRINTEAKEESIKRNQKAKKNAK